MMHEREKSDPAVVAVKPVNNAERSAAESVEPRAGAEGNASQHSTGRAQKRATVSQGLERIRQVARQRTKEKFTTLLHHISTDHLGQAFLELKEDAAPGVEMPCRPTIRRWPHSASSSPNFGSDRSGDAVRKTARLGRRLRSWPKIGSRNRIPFIHA